MTEPANRRSFLRGIGACLALPSLESLAKPGIGTQDAKSHTRLAYLYFPNGTARGSWVSRKVGKSGKLEQLNEWMAPLEEHKSSLVITSNLWTPRGNGHGAGTATWLTGGAYNRRKNDVGGPSVDQIAAQYLADKSPLPSLELSTS